MFHCVVAPCMRLTGLLGGNARRTPATEGEVRAPMHGDGLLARQILYSNIRQLDVWLMTFFPTIAHMRKILADVCSDFLRGRVLDS